MSISDHLRNVGIDVYGIRELLRNGSDPNLLDIQNEAPLHVLASTKLRNPQDEDNSVLVAKVLVESGAIVDILDRRNRTPLIRAIKRRNRKLVEFLLKKGASINHADRTFSTVMHYAVDKCCCPDGPDGKKRTSVRILEDLLERRPILDVVNNDDETLLTLAISKNELEIVQSLLKNGASVNFQDTESSTAMHYVLEVGLNLDILLELVRNGGDFGIADDEGRTPINNLISMLNGLRNEDIEKVAKVFKIFILLNNTLTAPQRQDVDDISIQRNLPFSELIDEYTNETNRMQVDELAPNYSVHDMALRGLLNQAVKDDIPDDIYDTVLNKMMEGEYPRYCDMIMAGIYVPYLKTKFAEKCNYIGNSTEKFLIPECRSHLARYLSPLDMLNMVVACSLRQ